jgi:ornithine carbamoyltransferase
MSAAIPTELRGLNGFLSIFDVDAAALRALLEFAIARKQALAKGRFEPLVRPGKVLTMVFQKPSLRTRLSFEVAMVQLGGHAVNLEDHQVGIGKREALKDVAIVMSSMCDAIMARVYEHAVVEALAAHATVPVINGLCDRCHPCQAGADFMTLVEHFGEPAGRRMAFVGDGNNVARSLAWSCAKLGMAFVLAAPRGYELDDAFVASIRTAHPSASLDVLRDPRAAVDAADVVVTDTWTSMGQEAEREQRRRDFDGFQVNTALMRCAKPDAVVLHCLPAYRNVEITDEVIDGPQSLVFAEAENRLHFQRALLEVLLAPQ